MLRTCLNSMIEFLDDNFLIDNIIKFSNGNLPSQSKEKLCVLIEEIIKKKNNNNNIKILIDNIIVKFTDDPIQEVRNSAFVCLANIKNYNSNLLLNDLNLLNNNKIKRINKFIQNNNINNNNNNNKNKFLQNNNNNIFIQKYYKN